MSSTSTDKNTLKQPAWITTSQNTFYKISIEDFSKLFGFYVIHTPVVSVSCYGRDVTEYGWDSNEWRKGNLKNYLFSIAELYRDSAFASEKKLDNMKNIYEKPFWGNDFFNFLDCERVAMYDSCKNKVLSICYHIRNAFAHGRFAVYDCGNDSVFVLEDVNPYKNSGEELDVRARMVLKKSTLLKWIDIIEAGPDSEEYQQYSQSKQKGKESTKEKKTDV